MNNWFTGVVEDRTDPLKLNRVKVRVFNIHSDDTALTQLEQLPWATVMMPNTCSGISGIGEAPHGLVEGSWVVGFFRDGDGQQDPVVMGSIYSQYDTQPNPNKGFADPNGVHPKYISAPDINEHARSTTTDELDARKVSVKKDLPIPSGTWSEPESMAAPVYPFNKVNLTESGHMTEVDDTAGLERLYRKHKAGTSEEIFNDGSRVNKIVSDNYEIIALDNHVYIGGSCKVTIVGDAEIQCSNAKIDADELVHIKTKTFKVEAEEKAVFTTPLVDCSNNVNAKGDVKDGVRTMAEDRAIFDAHTHSHGDPKTSPPNT